MIGPSFFVNHGGGPNPILGQHENIEIAQSLRDVPNYIDIDKLNAIIIVTAHWETESVTISSGNKHNLLFDYNNFPPETYKYKYEARGDAELAGRIHLEFGKSGIDSKLDSERGWDYGVFVPMLLINPSANVPIVQISILQNQSAQRHYAIGEVLKRFRKDGIAIMGSGMTYHNEAGFRRARPSDGVIENKDFDNFLDVSCKSDAAKRKELFLNWDKQRGALESHPHGEADHFMPLIVNAGAGGEKGGEKVFGGVYLGKFKISGYVWRDL